MSKKLLKSVAALLALAGLCAGQSRELVKITALVRSIDAVIKKHTNAELVFADVSDINSTAEEWQKFASVDALDKHREESEAYNIAYCWRLNGKLAAANFTMFSPSGDWTNYTYHYFRTDGTLAKAAIDYRTFEGDVILEQDLYFNAAGKQIKKVQRILDLRTHKPKRLTRDVRAIAKSLAEEVDPYTSTSKLPFAKLFK